MENSIMPEISPSFTYSPEGTLTVYRARKEIRQLQSDCGMQFVANQELEDYRDRATEWLADLPGAEVSEQEQSSLVTIPVSEALEAAIAGPSLGSFDPFIGNIAALLPKKGEPGAVDRVITTPILEPTFIRARIYHHFQRWLNQNGLTEDVAFNCISAMATPWGTEAQEQAREDFRYDELPGAFQGSSRLLEVIARRDEFGFEQYTRRRRHTVVQRGHGEWQWFGLEPYGNECRIGVDGRTRRQVRIAPEISSLYPMYADNLDTGRQALGILLGLGSLAHAAAEYQGDEEILAGITWEKSERWTWPVPPVRH
jgi:hypothetical protein